MKKIIIILGIIAVVLVIVARTPKTVVRPLEVEIQASTTPVVSSSTSTSPIIKPPYTEAYLKSKLTALQYHVTQEEGTEPAYSNEYWETHDEGIYVDIISGEPLFSSKDKYDSHTGWPSFTKPIENGHVTLKTDTILFIPRTEVRSKISDAHLGHLFNDGPAPLGTRYCMNSASLRFIPKAQMEKLGYGAYLSKI